MITKEPTTWPTVLQMLPRDLKRNLPIPFIARREVGEHDFTTINSDQAVRCFQEKLCAVCGNPLGWWCVFLGGSLSAASGTYQTPFMHEECAEAALALCPYIVIPHSKRSTPRHASPGSEIGPNQDPAHPDKWLMCKCRTNQVEAKLVGINGKNNKDGVALLFIAGKWKSVRVFAYVDGVLTEAI